MQTRKNIDIKNVCVIEMRCEVLNIITVMISYYYVSSMYTEIRQIALLPRMLTNGTVISWNIQNLLEILFLKHALGELLPIFYKFNIT